VRAFGLNRAEMMFREGAYLETPVLPSLLGTEASGEVESVGQGVNEFAPDDIVSTIPAFSMTQYGVPGDTAIVPAHAVVKHPTSLSWTEATSIDRSARDKGGDQQGEQASRYPTARLTAAIEHAVIVGEMRILAQASDPKRRSHGAASRAEHGTDQQHRHTLPGRGGEHVSERRHPIGKLHARRFKQPVIRHLNPDPISGVRLAAAGSVVNP
jgi:hypothetical protein